MAIDYKLVLLGSIISVLLVVGAVSVDWYIEKDASTISRNGEKLAKIRWHVEAERTSFLLDGWYDRNMKCPKVLNLGGHISASGKSCMYPDDYYEMMSRSLIGTEVTKRDNIVVRDTPSYMYGTRGSYAGHLYESYVFEDTLDVEQFPAKYLVDWVPRDTRNYQLVLRVWDLKDFYLPDGEYHACKYEAKYFKIDLKQDCDNLEKAVVQGNRIWFYFNAERGKQFLDIKIVDPVHIGYNNIYAKNKLKGIMVKTKFFPYPVHVKNNVLSNWSVPIGSRNFVEFGECRDFEIEKQVCSKYNLEEV